jgi:hypothetical protein
MQSLYDGVMRVLLLLLLLLLACSPEQPAVDITQEECPNGMVNDPYPGSCMDYIDLNQNGICDRSE